MSCSGCITPQYGYRNNLLYGAYIAESFTRSIDLAVRHNVTLDGLLTWAFEYEAGYGDWFDGFRVLSTEGVNKPVLTAHRMLSRVSGMRVQAVSDGQVALVEVLANGVHGVSSVGVLAALGSRSTDPGQHSAGFGRPVAHYPVLRVFIWNYHDNNLNYSSPSITVSPSGLPHSFQQRVKVSHYRIDDEHADSYTT